jgi:endoglucanase
MPLLAQDRPAATAFARARHLSHGINLSHWFSQNASDYSAHHTETETTSADIALIARLGFDHVRLSIDPTPLEQSPRWPDELNDDFLGRLDRAVDSMIDHGLAVEIDIHLEDSYKQRLRTDDAAVDRLAHTWRLLAAHLAGRDSALVFFEILNEPEVSDANRWAGIQARLAAAIREAAPRQTIIATGPNYSGIRDLLTQQPLSDPNVIYNFHFYDPHTFTHQGATWGLSWWSSTHGIPYPPTEESMQSLSLQVADPAARFDFENYWLEHWDARHIRLLIDQAAAWGHTHNVPLICNEFGAYRRVTDPVSRVTWISDVRTALEADGIGWAMWDFHGDFGVVTSGHGTTAQVDSATVAALGLPAR